jgi:shikimate dehydrogenase
MVTDKPFILAGVMGWPVAHSRSPAIHNYWIRHYGLNGSYVLLPVQPERITDAVRGLRALGFAGCNITIPHKVAAMPLVDRIDPLAARIGAINTVVVEKDGTLAGYNTDAYGYIQSLLDAQPAWRADAGPVTVLGAGGAARAILVALAERGAKDIRLCNRSLDKAQALAAEFGAPIRAVPWEQREQALQDAALLVNTTSLGMKGQDALDIGLERLPRHALVSDIVYVPLETPLLAAARARGHIAVDGLGMLLNQARPAFQHWFGLMPELTPELRRLVEATL